MAFIENEHIELKKSTSELKDGIISIASILNKHGRGELYFGVRNDGTLIGQEVTDKTLRDISQAISNHIEPKIFPVITRESEKSKNYIKIIFRGTDAPYFAYGRVYSRVADEDKLLSPSEVEKMILQKNIYQSRWDSELTGHELTGANKTTLSRFLKQAQSVGRAPATDENPEVVLGKLELLKNGKLSYAAWHLFCDHQPVELQLAVFRGSDKTSFKDIKPPVRGNLFYLLEAAENYIKDKINWHVEFGVDMKRHEIPEIPVLAFREAIVNSFAHRNFNDPKSNEIAVFADRIEIYNPGSFPEGLTPDDFIYGNERSHLRNPKIAEVFYYTRDIDRWGSGFQRIDKECRENNIEYRFDILSTGFLVTFIRPAAFIEKDKDTGGIKGGTKGGIKTPETGGMKTTEIGGMKTPETGGMKTPETGGMKTTETGGIKGGIKGIILSGALIKLPDRQKDVLLLIADDNRISISKVAQKLGIARSAAQKHFDALKTKNIITREEGDKGGYWNFIINIEKLGI